MPKQEQKQQEHSTSLVYREVDLQIDRAELERRAETATGDQRIPIALSSEHPADKYDVIRDEKYTEILDHTPEAVDLSRAADGLPLLLNHGGNSQVGLIENLRVDSDRVLRGEMRFSRSQLGQEIRQDVVDGIRRKVSVGGIVNRRERVEDGDSVIVHVRNWTPMEGSLVALPADPTVGVGRSQEKAEGVDAGAPEHKPATIESAPVARSIAMPDNGAAAQNGAVNVGTDELAIERKRARDVMELCSQENVTERAAEWIEAGYSADRVGREILALKREHGEAKPISTPEPQSHLEGLNEKERKQYSIGRAYLAAASGKWENAGFEAEVSRQIAKNLGRETEGFFMPTDVPWTTRQLNAGTATEGAELVPTVHGSFIDLLRSRLVVARMGARMLTGLRGNISFPRQSGAGEFSWREEVPGADLADSHLDTDNVELSPKAGSSTTAFSRQLQAQSVPLVDQIVRDDLLAITQRGIDRAALHGTGLNNQPEGIYAADDVNPVAFGGPISWAKVVEMESAVAAADADLGTLGYVVTPEVRGDAKTILKAANAGSEFAGSFIWQDVARADGGPPQGEMNGYRAIASNQLAKDLGVGDDEHGMIYGNWADLLIGEWGAIELIVDPFAQKKRGLIEVTVFVLADVALRHGQSFSKATGLELA